MKQMINKNETTEQSVGITFQKFATMVKESLEQKFSDCEINISTITKNNGRKRTGITIKMQNCNIAPNIYVEEYYEQYKAGKDMEAICLEIAAIYEANKKSDQFNVEHITEFDLVQKDICYRLVNASKNTELLKTVPYRMYQDLAIIYYIMVAKEENEIASAVINNGLITAWNTDEESLYELARENTPKLLVGCVNSLSDVLNEILGAEAKEGEENLILDDSIFKENVPMYVASNSNKINGAATILYEGILTDFAKRVGDKNFYILPSSIHEVLFIPESQNTNKNEFVQMVREVNETQVQEDEILSDNIYYYHADSGRIEMIE